MPAGNPPLAAPTMSKLGKIKAAMDEESFPRGGGFGMDPIEQKKLKRVRESAGLVRSTAPE